MSKQKERKSLRYEGFDYSTPGAYFITICTENKVHRFGTIIDEIMYLNNEGKIVEQILSNIHSYYINTEIPFSVVMPNHVHMIIMLNGNCELPPDHPANQRSSISEIVARYKSYATKMIGDKFWQRSFYDHIIRNQEEYNRIGEYIQSNSKFWGMGRNPLNPQNIDAIQTNSGRHDRPLG